MAFSSHRAMAVHRPDTDQGPKALNQL